MAVVSLVSQAHASAQKCDNFPTDPVQVYRSQFVNNKFEGLKVQQPLNFEPLKGATPLNTVTINPHKRFQEMLGFGASMTESCAINMQRLPAHLRIKAMNDLFNKNGGAGFDYIRIPMGASDFADGKAGSYTYCDTPGNRPDPQLKYFSLKRDEKSLELIKEAKKINPNLKVMISPWSPPAWMKIPKSVNGGGLNPKFYDAFARYFVRTIQEMEKFGVPVESLTIQNEPGYAPDFYPSMGMNNDEQITFIRDYLAPELRKAGLNTGIYVLDHNWDMYADVNTILDDKVLKSSVRGVAYHCYGGEPEMMEESNRRHPEIHVLQTECSDTLANKFDVGAIDWWLGLYSMRATNAGSSGSMAWNLCLDEAGGPTNNGCPNCRGIITMDFSKSTPVLRHEPEFHAFAQISRFLQPGTKRIEASLSAGSTVKATAFVNSDHSVSLVLWNPTPQPVPIRVQRTECAGFDYTMNPTSAVTLTWPEPTVRFPWRKLANF